MGIKQFTLGVVAGFLLSGCAAYTFAYKYYGMQFAAFPKGVLLGPTPADDQDFAKCQGNGCVVMFKADFFALKQDHSDCENNLEYYQKVCKP